MNGNWVYEVTGENVEQSESRNTAYRSSATELVFNTTVKNIGYMAFRYWENLKKVIFNSDLQNIGSYSFESCKSLLEVVIPDSVFSVGAFAFSTCTAIEKLIVGSNVESVQGSAFINLYSLETLVFRGAPPLFGESVFGNGGSLNTDPSSIYVLDVASYKAAHNFFQFKSTVYPLSDYIP